MRPGEQKQKHKQIAEPVSVEPVRQVPHWLDGLGDLGASGASSVSRATTRPHTACVSIAKGANPTSYITPGSTSPRCTITLGRIEIKVCFDGEARVTRRALIVYSSNACFALHSSSLSRPP